MRYFTKCLYLLLILTILKSNNLEAQVDSSTVFKQQRGNLIYPLSHIKRVVKPGQIHDDPLKDGWRFISDKQDSVKAMAEGRVVLVSQIEENYFLLITKFGDYYIAYIGLSKGDIKKGDYLKKGQYIATISDVTFENEEYQLEVSLSKKDEYLNLNEWLKD